ncbi:hypothetical protein VT84_06145 [Gemmata sp. SH-PL17]|uniref:hypothetical protein n=1 Tax=Gemmata sp. SH-PL17 TaxID=1630693 RepID=UPI0004B420C7|nr:hypothetical protein [Gemmata sp. SH-PL17]AMV23956.1 hypothetical protein VT84_06145 [Gemmata sp. SH-PL17]
MKRFVILAAVCGLAIGCGGSEVTPTASSDAIKREQERLGGGGGPANAPKGAKDDAVKREQDRLKGGR